MTNSTCDGKNENKKRKLYKNVPKTTGSGIPLQWHRAKKSLKGVKKKTTPTKVKKNKHLEASFFDTVILVTERGPVGELLIFTARWCCHLGGKGLLLKCTYCVHLHSKILDTVNTFKKKKLALKTNFTDKLLTMVLVWGSTGSCVWTELNFTSLYENICFLLKTSSRGHCGCSKYGGCNLDWPAPPDDIMWRGLSARSRQKD